MHVLIQPQVERLEGRALCAGSAELDPSGLLTILGTESLDQISVSLVNHRIRISIVTSGEGSVARDFASGVVTQIQVDGGAERDNINVAGAVLQATTVRGGSGRDNIESVPAGTTVLTDFADLLTPAANTLIRYVQEEDSVTPASISFAVSTTSDPVDLLEVSVVSDAGETAQESWEYEASGIVVQLSELNDNVSVSNQPGAPLLDVRTGLGADVITIRGEGLVKIDAAAGDDIINGGTYEGVSLPTLIGGSGNDSIEGSQGGDVLSGGSGNDTLRGINGNDLLEGGIGNDLFEYPFGDFVLSGGAGIDELSYEGINSARLELSLDGVNHDGAVGDGGNIMNDVENLTGGGLADLLRGNTRANVLRGGGGNDTIFGAEGDDTLIGDRGRDVLMGQAGSDFLISRDGLRDIVDGGTGSDSAKVDDSSSVQDPVRSIVTFL